MHCPQPNCGSGPKPATRFAGILVAALLTAAVVLSIGAKAQSVAVIDAPSSPSPFAGCQVEAFGAHIATAVSGSAWADSVTSARLGLGLGCAMVLRERVLIGGFARASFADDRDWSVAARLGLIINPHLAAYGFTGIGAASGWRAAATVVGLAGGAETGGISIHDARLIAGIGIETFVLSDRVTVFVEAQKDVLDITRQPATDTVTRIGVRYRFFSGW